MKKILFILLLVYGCMIAVFDCGLLISLIFSYTNLKLFLAVLLAFIGATMITVPSYILDSYNLD